MARWALLVVTATVAAGVAGCGSCGSGDPSGPPITRDRDAVAVVVVKRPGDNVSYTDEVEPNNEAAAAQVLELPGGVRGTLDGETDVDLYKISLAEPGWLEVRIGGIEDADLIFELQGADGAAIARSDRGPAKTAEGVPNIRIEPGDYLLAVSEFVKKRSKKSKKGPRTGPSASYKLSARLTTDEPPRSHEREPNEEPTTAMELLLGVDGFGYVGWKDDRDRWRLTLDNFGEDYSLDVDIAPVAEVRLRVSVLDDNGDAVAKRSGDKGKALAIRNLIPKEGDDHVYLEISGRGSNPLERYAVRMNSRLLDPDEEREPNDESKNAGALQAAAGTSSGVMRGYLVAGDEDWYSLQVSGSQLLTISLMPPAEVDATLTLQRADGTMLGEGNAGKAGEREELTSVPVSGRVLIKVHGEGTAESLEYYELRWNVGPRGAAPVPTYDPYE